LTVDKNAPIGVFDSGVGGLTVLRELEKAMPAESFIYFGDTAHVPYGARKPEEIQDLAIRIGRFLERQGCKMILIACNTSTALAHDLLGQALSIPVVGVIEPVVEKVCAESVNLAGKEVAMGAGMPPVGVIATQATVISNAYQRVFKKKAPLQSVLMVACPTFVPLIEAGVTEGAQVENDVETYLTPLKEKGIRTLILGCTHYPFLSHPIQHFFGDDVDILDPAIEAVRQGKHILAVRGLLANGQKVVRRFISSGDPKDFRKGASLFWVHPIDQVEQIIL